MKYEAGIVTFGGYVPMFRIKAEEIARIWNKDADSIKGGMSIFEKSVQDMDEDTVTMAVEAARITMSRVFIDPSDIGSIYVGSESHPYSVKPSATIVAAAIQATPIMTAADFEFACKAGTAAIQVCMSQVESDHCKFGMAIGADTAQSRPGDPLEYTAAAGAAAFLIGKTDVIADIHGTYSVTTDTPDFWRREGMNFPKHSGRFTGEPAYFKHIFLSTRGIMDKFELQPEDITHAVFHQPNGKFPLKVSKMLGFTKEQMEKGLLVQRIGNTYSASSLLGLVNVLDSCSGGERIIMSSFGSGAGSDAFYIEVKDDISGLNRVDTLERVMENIEYIDYARYAKHNGKIVSS